MLSQIDVSDQSGELWRATADWLGPNHENMIMTGAGSLLDVREGVVREGVSAPLANTVEELVAFLERASTGA